MSVSQVHGRDEVMAVTHIVSSDTAEMRGSVGDGLGLRQRTETESGMLPN